MRKSIRIMLSFLFFVFISSCAQKGLESDVNFVLTPEKPQIIPVTITFQKPTGEYDGNNNAILEDVTLTGPWFEWTFTTKNHSSNKTVTITGVDVLIVADTRDGKTVEFKQQFGPSDVAGATETNRTYMLEVPAGYQSETSTLYVQGLPTLKDVYSLRFHGKMTFYGWQGTSTSPEKIFQKTIYFGTTE
ncbi:MAG: hypothetical protein H6623_05070 [Bdellovibrionaceae bacterium]|nr:hypothetical protein [Pseudobdellovibrionaceae bacterium]